MPSPAPALPSPFSTSQAQAYCPWFQVLWASVTDRAVTVSGQREDGIPWLKCNPRGQTSSCACQWRRHASKVDWRSKEGRSRELSNQRKVPQPRFELGTWALGEPCPVHLSCWATFTSCTSIRFRARNQPLPTLLKTARRWCSAGECCSYLEFQ